MGPMTDVAQQWHRQTPDMTKQGQGQAQTTASDTIHRQPFSSAFLSHKAAYSPYPTLEIHPVSCVPVPVPVHPDTES